MSLERKYQPRKGIMLSTFKSVSQLDTTNFDSSAQSPQYKSKKEKPGLNMSYGISEKRGFPLRRVSLREKQSGIEWDQSLDRTLEAPVQRKRSYRRSIESIIHEGRREKPEAIAKKSQNSMLEETFDFALCPTKSMKSINITKGELRRLVYGRTRNAQTEKKKNKIYLSSNKENMVSTNNSEHGFIKPIALLESISVQVQTGRGSTNKLCISTSEEPNRVVEQIRSQFELSVGVSNHLLSLIQKQFSHLSKINARK